MTFDVSTCTSPYENEFALRQNYDQNLPENTIYLDYAAATPVLLKTYSIMEPWLLRYFGNPAARLHPMGYVAENALSESRQHIADLIKVSFEEVIFTSSATESNNLVLRGLTYSPLRKRNKIAYVATEHSSIISTVQTLQEELGSSCNIIAVELPVDGDGQVDLNKSKELIDDNTLCVCAMDINNETGIIQQNLNALIEQAHAVGAWVHVDAVQGLARSSINTQIINFDTATLSSSKIYGPRGAAALIIRRRSPRIRVQPQLTGGGHEFQLRSSTPDVASIVGFASSARWLCSQDHPQKLAYLSMLEKHFIQELCKHQKDFVLYGKNAQRAPGIMMLSIPGVNAMKLIEECKTLCVSVGSACKTLQATASHVLLAMGVDLDQALASFRVSLGLPNTLAEVERAALHIAQTADRVKRDSAILKPV